MSAVSFGMSVMRRGSVHGTSSVMTMWSRVIGTATTIGGVIGIPTGTVTTGTVSSFLFVREHYAFRKRPEIFQLTARKAGVAEHGLEFSEGVGVAVGSGCQHHHAEGGGHRR